MSHGLPPRIGPYEPIELLAQGGMARVVVARRTGIEGFERLVALKLILPELASDAQYTTMFLDEARINSRVQHVHVVGVLDVGRDERTQILFMAMDLVLGATLSQVVRGYPDPLPIGVVLEVIAQAAEGLDAAHGATASDGAPLEIVHRDVSPSNLLIGLDGVVRISDFGVARAAHRLTKTKTGQFKGKLTYCSPEQALGKTIDRRSDIFALGVVAWELAARRRLFHGATPFETLERIMREPIEPIGALRPEMPARAAAVIMQMLERDPAARPPRASEVAEVLRDALARGSFEAPQPVLRAVVRGVASPVVRRLAGIPDRGAEVGVEAAPDASRVTSVARPSADPDRTTIDIVADDATAVVGWRAPKE